MPPVARSGNISGRLDSLEIYTNNIHGITGPAIPIKLTMCSSNQGAKFLAEVFPPWQRRTQGHSDSGEKNDHLQTAPHLQNRTPER